MPFEEILPIIKIAFLDVGQGDTVVISCSDTHEAIVVDCVDAKAVLNYLKQEEIMHLRGVIITHLHADHYKDVASLLYNCSEVLGVQGCEVLACNEIINPRDLKNPKTLQKLKPDADGHSSVYEQPSVGAKKLPSSSLAKLFLWCQQNKLKCEPIRVTQRTLPFAGTMVKTLHLLHPYHTDYAKLKMQGLNNTSVVLRITGPNSSALLTGDLEPDGWQQLQANHPDIHSDVLKFPHHGGAWNDMEASMLLDSVKPSVVVISVGTEGYTKYDHPNPEVFTALSKDPHVRILCTQATDQCHRENVAQNERTSVVNQFKAQADKNGHQHIISKRGCPCAGTVIIELGDKARVIQPEIQFHHGSIIKPHFKNHKCNIEETLI